MSPGLTIVLLSVGAILVANVSVGAVQTATDANNTSTVVTPSPQTTAGQSNGTKEPIVNATSSAGPLLSTALPTKQSAGPSTQSDNSDVTETPSPNQHPSTSSPSGNTPVPVTPSPNASATATLSTRSSTDGLNTTVSSPTTQKASVSPADNTSSGTNTSAATVAPTTLQSNISSSTGSNGSTVQPTNSNSSVMTQSPAPTNRTVTEQPTTSATAVPPVVTNASVTTHGPSPTNGSVVTQVPVSPSANTSNTSSKPDTNNGTSTNETSTTMSPNTTDASKVTEKPATNTSAGPPTGQQIMYINEIMLDRHGGFQKIELYVSNQVDLAHYAMVMVDGGTNKTMSITHLEHLQQNNSLIMVSFDNTSSPMMTSSGIGIAIYDTNQMSSVFTDSWTVSKDGLVDALVIGRTYAEIPDHLVQTLTPGMIPFVLDPSLYGNEKTITRCSAELLRSTDMFALVNPSIGRDNGLKCQERLHYQNNLELKFSADCGMFNQSSETGRANTKHLMHFVIKEVNKKCHCGMTRMHIEDPKVSCCGGTNLDMKFVAPNEHQGDALLTNYKSFIQSTADVKINDKIYKLDNSCYSNCCSSPVPSKGDDKSKNMKVTVAVIVTCMLVFMVIVILVVLYMRRKKTAVYQFRMSRLNEEEEDYPMGVGDQDEFVGGQEATFDIKA